MPGLRYTHRFKSGPYIGEDCRILEQPAATPDYLRVKIRGRRRELLFPLTWIIPKNGRKPHGVPRRGR